MTEGNNTGSNPDIINSDLINSLKSSLSVSKPGRYTFSTPNEIYYISRTFEGVKDAITFRRNLSFQTLAAYLLLILAITSSCDNVPVTQNVDNTKTPTTEVDLWIKDGSVSKEYLNLKCENRDIGLSIVVSEFGSRDSIGFRVSFNDANEGGGISRGDSNTRIWVPQNIYLNSDTKEITITVDPDNQINETNENNNTKTISIEEYNAMKLGFQNPDCAPPKLDES